MTKSKTKSLESVLQQENKKSQVIKRGLGAVSQVKFVLICPKIGLFS